MVLNVGRTHTSFCQRNLPSAFKSVTCPQENETAVFVVVVVLFFFNKKSLTAIWAPLDHHLRSAPLCRPFSIMTTTTSSSSTTAGNVSYSAIQDEPQRLVQGFSFISAGTFHNCKLNFNVRLPGSSFKQNL